MTAGVWLDAAWAKPAWIEGPIPFDPSDRGLLLGDGVFGTALVLGGRMVWRTRHVERLMAGCRALGFTLDPDRVDRALAAVLPRMDRGSLRLTVTRGAGPRGLAPPAQPYATLLVAPAPPSAAFMPVRLCSTTIRRNERSPLSRLKSLAYADNVLATTEARNAGGDEALMLNTRDHVACAGTANVFAVIDGQLVTPPLADGVLDGIARAVLLEVAARSGPAPVERSLTLADLRGATAIFATSSLRLVAPVIALDGVPLPNSVRLGTSLAQALAVHVVADVGTDPR